LFYHISRRWSGILGKKLQKMPKNSGTRWKKSAEHSIIRREKHPPARGNGAIQDMKAALVIMAAGMGSRYGGEKQTDGIGPHGEAIMEYSVFDAVRAGFHKIVFIIKPGMEPTI